MRAHTAIAVLFVAVVVQGCGRPETAPAEHPDRLTIELRSPEFAEGGDIPSRYTCDGENRSPPLEWSGIPKTSRSLVIICDDPDAPSGTWSHWVLFNLPAHLGGIKQGVPAGQTVPTTALGDLPSDANDPPTRQGKNDFGDIGYGGPCPPSGTHRYFFRLYALDSVLDLRPAPTRTDVLKSIQSHVLAEGRLMGKFARAGKKKAD
jgi:Raf kinase inhibitor-like YbhB/YbcL family protein